MDETLGPLFVKFSGDKLKQLEGRIQDCLGRLTAEQIWGRGGENQNAVGNLVLHLCGNVRQWIGATVAGKPDIRVREREFSSRGGIEPSELGARLAATVEEALADLGKVTADRLRESVTVQGYRVTVLEAIYHVVEHFSQHTGQILLLTKMHTGADLGYYRHLSQAAAKAENTP